MTVDEKRYAEEQKSTNVEAQYSCGMNDLCSSETQLQQKTQEPHTKFNG